MRKGLLVLATLLFACDGSTDAPTPAPEDGADTKVAEPPAPAEADTCGTDRAAVTLTTDDGVELIADMHPSGKVGAPGIVLLHMIPPHHDKSNYSPQFIAELVGHGWSVVNVNRRGAKGSGGVAEEAYKGDKGWLDAKAGRDFLLDHGCAVPAERIVIVGASNGTTSALDFTVHASADDAMPPPKALVFLSGGKYTEAQHKIADNAASIDTVPILFAYPADEAEWNLGIQGAAKAGEYGSQWHFKAYEAGGHGTKIFDSTPPAMAEVAEFVAGQL